MEITKEIQIKLLEKLKDSIKNIHANAIIGIGIGMCFNLKSIIKYKVAFEYKAQSYDMLIRKLFEKSVKHPKYEAISERFELAINNYWFDKRDIESRIEVINSVIEDLKG